MLTNDVEICNMALDLLGKVPILSLGDGTDEATRCVRNYKLARASALARSPWTFARKRVVLARRVNDMAATWGYRYDRPSDAVSLRAVLPESARYTPRLRFCEYEIMGGSIYTDCPDAHAVYSYDHTVVAEWHQPFADLVAVELAMRLAPGLVRRDSDMRRLEDMRTTAFDAAVMFDAAQEYEAYAPEDLPLAPMAVDNATYWG